MRALIVIATFLALPGWAQIQLTPLARETKISTGRTQASELKLPFWDDFSFSTNDKPSDSLWINCTTVWVNDGMAINPPSVKVATFDGLDAEGKPYNVNNVLAKGYADQLESQIIRLDQIDVNQRPSVFFSFFYEMKGRGETPDLGDILYLQFKNASEKWETVWSIENNGSMETDRFQQVILPIAEEKFYHSKFQFRFQNFARLSGPYDTWHVDYIYINQNRTISDLSYPDRSLASSLGGIFPTYQSIPKKHFFAGSAELIKPSFTVHNLRTDNIQPLNYFTTVDVTTYKQETNAKVSASLDVDTSIGSVAGGEFKQASVDANGLGALLSNDSDSIEVNLKLGLNTKDNITPDDEGDYDPGRFSPIDFRNNDTLRAHYWLSSYYAYDDGTAEYGAALNQPGAQLAYEFNMTGVTFDSLAAIDFYFPRFGDETSQVIELRVWSALTDNTEDVIYRETVTIERSNQNIFWRKKLPESKRVPARFYVGWKQSSAAVIAVGLDKNSDSGAKMFYNIIGTWEPNTQLQGNLMIRPVFGKGKKSDLPDVGLADERGKFQPYPNPSQGSFAFAGHADGVQVYDQLGQPILFEETRTGEETHIRLSAPQPGLYIIRIEQAGAVRSAKLLVTP